jgi:hypothetical protein
MAGVNRANCQVVQVFVGAIRTESATPTSRCPPFIVPRPPAAAKRSLARRAGRVLLLRREQTLEFLELGPQFPIFAFQEHDAPPLGHEILGHLVQRAPNPVGSDLLHVAGASH